MSSSNEPCSVKRGLKAFAKKVSTHVSLHRLRRLTWAKTFSLLQILCILKDNSTSRFSCLFYEKRFYGTITLGSLACYHESWRCSKPLLLEHDSNVLSINNQRVVQGQPVVALTFDLGLT